MYELFDVYISRLLVAARRFMHMEWFLGSCKGTV